MTLATVPRDATLGGAASSAGWLLLVLGCASTVERPEPQFRISQENRPFLISPLTGYPRGVAPSTTQQLGSGFAALMRDGDSASAHLVSRSLLDVNPSLHPAQLLDLQARFVEGKYSDLAEGLDGIVADIPGFQAAVVLRARVFEILNNIPMAFELYWSVQSSHQPSASKVNELRIQALAGAGQAIQSDLNLGHLEEAERNLEKLQLWAPGELPTFRMSAAVAVALEDPGAELIVRVLQIGALSSLVVDHR